MKAFFNYLIYRICGGVICRTSRYIVLENIPETIKEKEGVYCFLYINYWGAAIYSKDLQRI